MLMEMMMIWWIHQNKRFRSQRVCIKCSINVVETLYEYFDVILRTIMHKHMKS